MSNFIELSGGDSTRFLMRWRGRQEGPYLASVIEAKLMANEIGLLHEIFYEGEWMAIRDYIFKRESILRAELEAREDRQRQVSEEEERQAKEREELITEERRRLAPPEPLQARENLPQPLQQPAPATSGSSSSLKILGAIFLIAGLGITGYFFLDYDTSVESGYGRVNNFGLMADRQNGIIIGIGIGIVGAIMFATGSRGKN